MAEKYGGENLQTSEHKSGGDSHKHKTRHQSEMETKVDLECDLEVQNTADSQALAIVPLAYSFPSFVSSQRDDCQASWGFREEWSGN